MKIQDIRRPKGAHRAPKRVGRGSGSGWGKTSGRGTKGSGSRSGPALRTGFEGGQMPLIRRLPKRGFTKARKKIYQIVNVESLNRFKKDSSIDKAAMREAGLIKKMGLPVKVLGDGKISTPVSVVADAFSAGARKKILDAGGKIETTLRTYAVRTRVEERNVRNET